jgi:hypothetical protein
MAMGSQETLEAVSGSDDGTELLAIADDLLCRLLPRRA